MYKRNKTSCGGKARSMTVRPAAGFGGAGGARGNGCNGGGCVRHRKLKPLTSSSSLPWRLALDENK